MATVRDELIEMRGLRFHFRDWAAQRPGAPDLVLLHGYTSHARSWDAFAAAMTRKYRVLALDQRGHGESGWAARDAYGTMEMVADLQSFVQALGLRGFALLGLSMGGIVAYAYATRRPAELARLVLVDIGPVIGTQGLEKIQAGVLRPDLFASREAAFARAREDNPVPPEEHHRHRTDYSLMRTEAGQWTYRYDRALRDPDNPRERIPEADGWRMLAGLRVPTLVIRGARSDILEREVALRMAREIPDCSLEEVAGAGHSVPLDKPEEFLAVADAFL